MKPFKKDFLFGVSLSGPQTEGTFDKTNQSVMDYWYEIEPKDFYQNIGPGKTSNFYNNYEHVINKIKELKLEMYRTSIQWSRLYEDKEFTIISKKAINFYRQYFSELKKTGAILVVNLFHFDIPIVFLKQKGFENKQIIEKYVEYAKVCFENFNDLVDHWATFNEPMANVDSQYLNGHHYPKEKNLKKSIQVFYNMIVAHAKVVNLYNQNYKKQNQKITTIISLNPAIVRDKNNPLDILAGKNCDLLLNFSQLDPVIKGIFDKELISLLKQENLLPIYNQQELDEISKAKIDYVSLNYYQPLRVKQPNKNLTNHVMSQFFDFYDWPEKRINPSRGWEIYPESIYQIAMIIKNKYNNIAWIISENGMGVQDEEKYRETNGEINDQYRIDFIEEHLLWLQKAILEGSNCFGYSLWTFIDCWSWSNAYKNRYGLIEYNLKTDKYVNKKSSYWFKNIIESKEK